MKEFKFPDIGEGIKEGRVTKWLIKEGDFIKEHQVVAEVETDKAVSEILSPFEGKVAKVNFKEGDTVKVGETLFVIETENKEGEKDRLLEQKENKTATEFKPAGAVGYLQEAERGEVLATPAVRKLAKDLGVDLTKIKGSGPGGRITEEDVQNIAGQKEVRKKRKYDFWGYVDYIPLNNIRRVTASHMTQAWTNAPQVTIMDMPDIRKLIRFKEKQEKHALKQGIKLTYLPFIMRACYKAMIQYPLLNSTFDPESQEVVVKKYYNFGIAVDVGGEGLVVPVVKGVNIKTIFDIAKEIVNLATKARNKKLDIQDIRGGTFTITNYGSLGGLFATPIINFPEAAILGIGKITDNKLPLSLTFDHRILDGAYAVRFLNLITSFLQEPDKI